MDHNSGKSIVVGVDASPPAVAALRLAAQLARALDAPLHVVTTWSYPPFSEYSAITVWDPEEEADIVLTESVKGAFGDSPPAGLTREVLEGAPSPALIDVSASSRMLVLGNRGRGGFASLLLGSVSAACVAHAVCPVLVVHANDHLDQA
ncbi:nucleotide-binding universal stress UspA family protein [Microbacterium proteolyticum]|uniref:Nucleotide-binding universal stress UspA family protein n=1 Tax=Microbacterium proteolyticum TaxID=1572644 RepID=A0A7W5CIL3_9MICO|nr:universal stress protein [Microbacterium proteolyticum]MBB3158331.1 nucleotide-binding universal stress UspA family protein [Microbacterium proteolyticum]